MSLEIRTDMIETTSMMPDYRPDPDWVHVDSNGHEHRWVDGTLPTLEHYTEDYVDADGDEDSQSWYQCVECDDEVKPGYKEVPGTGGGYRTFMPGMTHYYIDGREVTRAEAERYRDARSSLTARTFPLSAIDIGVGDIAY